MQSDSLSDRQRNFVETYILKLTAAKSAQVSSEDGAGRAPDEATEAEKAQQAIPEGTVRKRSFMVDRWKQVPGELKVHIDALTAEIPRIAPWEDSAQVGTWIETHLNKTVNGMQSRINAAFTVDVGAGDGAYKQTRAAIEKEKSEIAADPLIAELQKGVIAPGAPFVDALARALRDIDQNFASGA